MAEVMGGVLDEAVWMVAEQKARMVRSVAAAQLHGARMLGEWARLWRPAQRAAAEREKVRGTLGAVYWAWRVVAARARGREVLVNTQEVAEQGGRMQAWLPPAGVTEWSYRPGPTAVESGSVGAWLLWYARWTARGRRAHRLQWAAWLARRGGRRGLRRRYVEAVKGGAWRVGKGATAARAHEERWERECRVADGLAQGAAWAEGWGPVWVETSARVRELMVGGAAAEGRKGEGGEVTLVTLPGRAADALGMAREWQKSDWVGYYGVRVKVVAEAPSPPEEEAQKKRARRCAAGRLQAGARERWRMGWGREVSASAGEGGGGVDAPDEANEWGVMEEDEAIEREWEWGERDAFGDG